MGCNCGKGCGCKKFEAIIKLLESQIDSKTQMIDELRQALKRTQLQAEKTEIELRRLQHRNESDRSARRIASIHSDS